MTKEIPIYFVYVGHGLSRKIDKIFLNEKMAEEYKSSISACCEPMIEKEVMTIDENTFNKIFT